MTPRSPRLNPNTTQMEHQRYQNHNILEVRPTTLLAYFRHNEYFGVVEVANNATWLARFAKTVMKPVQNEDGSATFHADMETQTFEFDTFKGALDALLQKYMTIIQKELC